MTNYIKYVVFLLISVKAEIRIYLTDTPIQRIGGRIYKKELLTDKFSSPKELAYDSSSRNLFFMYMDDELQNSGRGYINVVTKQSGKIRGIEKNKATAVDQESGDVYFGSEDGLYKYDALNKEAANIGLYNMNIMKLVVKNNEMYLLDGNDHMIYKVFNEELNDEGLHEIDCRNGTARKVAELDFLPRSIIFGDYGDIFYSVDDSIYRLRPIQSYQVYKIHRKTKS